MTKEEYLKTYKRCILNEYTSFEEADSLNEADPAAAGDPMDALVASAGAAAAPAADPNAAAPAADPNAAAPAADSTMAAAPAADSTMAAAPAADSTMAAAPAADSTMAAAPATPSAPTQASGFTPDDGSNDSVNDTVKDNGDKIDDVDDDLEDTKKSQEDAENKIDSLTSKFTELMDKFSDLEEKIADNMKGIEALKNDMEKRNPTPEEKLSLRSRNSYPYSQSVDDFWDKVDDSDLNYSSSDDEDGVGSHEYDIANPAKKYQIKQSDIDNTNDWNSIAKSYDEERNGLRGILGY